jgi:oligopeptide transport system ATP-binding protein
MRTTGRARLDETLLDVSGLTVEFSTRSGPLRAVDDVSWTLRGGRTLAILGESGSGKSVSTQAITGILDVPPGRVLSGRAVFRGQDDLLAMNRNERRRIVGSRVGMVFQDALSALNPVHTVGRQIGELMRVHRGASRQKARERAVEMLDRVGIPSARRRVEDYPHEFSGGMRQRVMIAMALTLDPDVLIADEPTTALDVTVQAQILSLLQDVQAERQMGIVLITHDLGVVADVADDMVVMYAGRVVEAGPTADILRGQAHPYTEGLLGSMPSADLKGHELPTIPGSPPSLLHLPGGCAFHPRCGFATADCTTVRPPLRDLGAGRSGACLQRTALDLHAMDGADR